MQNSSPKTFFSYNLEIGVVLFSEDTDNIGKIVDDINILATKLKECETILFTVTVEKVKFVEDATRILILEVLCDLKIYGKTVVVNWYYDDSKILEIGQEFSELVDDVEFRFYELSKK
jgi:SiaC family regulatory phosphoprotein